jgi:oligoendopeptidase F
MDYYSLNGVPNTSFTEAFAFLFQRRDMELLGMKSDDAQAKDFGILDNFWDAYEIMGVSLVDMKVWNWMYRNPTATPAELKAAVVSIAKDVWNKYYADVFGKKDELILGIYSHMIDAGLYLPNYSIGHLIEFQIEEYLKDKPLGPEMMRMCASGNIIPQQWMKNAVGMEISAKPMLKAVDEVMERMK